MELEQILNVQPDGALMESIQSLQAALGNQTTLIYVLIAIAALSLLVAFAAIGRGRRTGHKKEAAAPSLAPSDSGSYAAGDAAIVAAISAAVSCVLAQEHGGAGNQNLNGGGFVVRRIRRV